jgi:predicted transcriptional regulator
MINLFELHDQVQDDLKFLVKSKIRLKILFSLLEGSKSMKEINEANNLSFATISNNMKRLIEENLVRKVENSFELTSFGNLKLDSIIDFQRSTTFSNKFEDLLLGHDISGVPDFLIQDIGVFSDSELVQSTPTDIYKTHNTFINLLTESEEIFGVSPISHPDYTVLFQDLLKIDVKSCLILTDDIIKRTVATADLKTLTSSITNKNLELRRYSGDELKIAFTVADNFVSLGFFNDDGTYDQNRDLVSKNKDAIDWTKMLFDYYYQRSEKVGITNLAKIMVS